MLFENPSFARIGVGYEQNVHFKNRAEICCSKGGISAATLGNFHSSKVDFISLVVVIYFDGQRRCLSNRGFRFIMRDPETRGK